MRFLPDREDSITILKEYKKLKNKLMDNIVENTDGSNKEITDEQRQKTQDDDKTF